MKLHLSNDVIGLNVARSAAATNQAERGHPGRSNTRLPLTHSNSEVGTFFSTTSLDRDFVCRGQESSAGLMDAAAARMAALRHREGGAPLVSQPLAARAARQGGSVLIIVLWIAFGLVSIALYFANSMTFELRGSDNRVAGQQAEQAIDGAMRYVNYLLTNVPTNGFAPDLKTYLSAGVPVGDSYFWLIGRTNQPLALDEPSFGLIDEASKLNLNTAPLEMLQLLPGMTAQLAAAIIDWRA